jgi:hypothetical protein
LLGQQNPWFHMLKNLKKVDCVLHVGDQIYPDNEDINHAGGLFGKLYDGLVRAQSPHFLSPRKSIIYKLSKKFLLS